MNISSVAGRFAPAGAAVYNLTKFGVTAFSEGLRQEVTEDGIRVIVVGPGVVATELHSHNPGEALEAPRACATRSARCSSPRRSPTRSSTRSPAAAHLHQRNPGPPHGPGVLIGA